MVCQKVMSAFRSLLGVTSPPLEDVLALVGAELVEAAGVPPHPATSVKPAKARMDVAILFL
jgi:hypothetical protein